MSIPSEEIAAPRDFLAAGWHCGIKAEALDFGVLYSQRPCTAAAVFTRNNYPGQPVLVGREHTANGQLQTIIVNSGNANVATGADGLALARESCRVAGDALGLDAELVLPSSTGVIGRPIPRDRLLGACAEIRTRLDADGADFMAFATAICTTDAAPKLRARELQSGVRLLGVAKGAGMIEPDMATMLAYFVCDAEIESGELQALFRALMDRTLNRISVDSDTSTSDTAILLANGASGQRLSFPPAAVQAIRELPIPAQLDDFAQLGALTDEAREFVAALYAIALELGKLIVADGEGAARFFEVQVSGARDADQALRVARSIANSPLVRTAIHGADPNWGRLVMAIGKVPDGPTDLAALKIFIGGDALHGSAGSDPAALARLSKYIEDHSEVKIEVDLGVGSARECIWSSDLSKAYVHLNSEYTT